MSGLSGLSGLSSLSVTELKDLKKELGYRIRDSDGTQKKNLIKTCRDICKRLKELDISTF